MNFASKVKMPKGQTRRIEMTLLTKELEEIGRNDPDVALVLNVFQEIERVYNDALEAMGGTNKGRAGVINSENVSTSFCPTSSTSDF